ncbi:hypothetical protein [Persicobacter sp. CCB-QB2]|uniref:hypothetical protein n=1 Tax=Persicobacter sp. CCB-QB2 TaxID=1561025 RepID=UPI0012FA10F6|nr:hypothetical protein [Persicobacter sp. CCB-QB2]
MSPKQVAQECRLVRRIEQVIELNHPPVGQLRRELGETQLLALIKIHLIDFNELLDLRKPLGERQIDKIAEVLLEQFPSLSFADIHFVFNQAMLGAYGELYESLNISKVMSWFKVYFEERTKVFGERSRLQADSHKSQGAQRKILEIKELEDFYKRVRNET